MARKLRVEYAGAIYPVLNRGDRREPIFKEEEDRERFIQTLGEVCVKTGWKVQALCLMADHFHLLVETPQANLVAKNVSRLCQSRLLLITVDLNCQFAGKSSLGFAAESHPLLR